MAPDAGKRAPRAARPDVGPRRGDGRAAARRLRGEGAAVTELRGLAELRADGILTEEEFTAKKRRVLGI